MLFEWDETKDLANQQKHGLSFQEVLSVFFNPLSVSRPDYHDGEHREQIIGYIYGVLVVVVVYTHRQRSSNDVIRIISARKATTLERKKYEAGKWL